MGFIELDFMGFEVRISNNHLRGIYIYISIYIYIYISLSLYIYIYTYNHIYIDIFWLWGEQPAKYDKTWRLGHVSLGWSGDGKRHSGKYKTIEIMGC